MRQKIIDNIFYLMSKDKRIFFLTADMGINLVEKIQEKYPDRFLNVGIAEQNLIGICAGLCNLGFLPFAYTISNFIIHRCFEQIRNDVILHSYPVTLVGTSAGFDNAPLGPTHHVLDDWGMLKSYPDIDVYCPNSNEYAANIVFKVIKKSRPCYIRVPKGSFKEIRTKKDIFYKKGSYKKIILISYGAPSIECIKVCEKLKISLLLFNKLHPISKNKIYKILINYENVVIVEDHFKGTGLFNSLCQIFINSNKKTFHSISPNLFDFKVGKTPKFFLKKHKIDSSSITHFLNKIK
jgi:transketolase